MKTIALLAFGGLLLMLILGWVVLQRQRGGGRKAVVLGQELARASAAEHRRQLAGEAEPSPMPAGDYDFWRGELSLIDPKPVPLDAELSALTSQFSAKDAATRARMRRAISMDELYTLLSYGKRAAVFALRERSAQPLIDGLRAIAMIEAERTDPRDILWTLAILHHAAERTGQEPERLFRDAASLAEPEVAQMFIDFPRGSASEKDLKHSWGYEELSTPNGPGLIGWGFEEYDPTYDLKLVAVEIARLLDADRYQTDEVQIASDLPGVWLRQDDAAVLNRALRSVRAAATVSARPRPVDDENYEHQWLSVFVAEATDHSDAQTLLRLGRTGKHSDEARIALAEERLFCLVIAASALAGERPIETDENLTRFSAELSQILARAKPQPDQAASTASRPLDLPRGL